MSPSCAEPFIERDQSLTAVVHFEILVVQVMRVGMTIERLVAVEFQLFKTDVPVDRAIGR